MQISVPSPEQQTMIFILLFALAFFALVRLRKGPTYFSLDVTSELKGFAMLTIVFGHIGYFLATDHRFLYPYSTMAGVGVDLFFLLSGFGLALSSLKTPSSPLEFYHRRIGKIFIPLWIVLALFFCADAFVLGHFYDWQVIVKSFLGFYPTADLYNDVNSPLWYLTPLLFYYLIFPWIFRHKRPLLSAAAIATLGFGIVQLNLPILAGVRGLHQLHFLAFPLGIVIAAVLPWLKKSSETVSHKIVRMTKSQTNSSWIFPAIRYLFLIFLLGIFYYTFIHSGVWDGPWIAQITSIVTTLSVTLIFIFKKLRFRLFEIIGLFSYEIYLLHWPLLYRYDFLYRFLAAGIATALFLIFVLGAAYVLQKLSRLTRV